jgi:hypothetical protein
MFCVGGKNFYHCEIYEASFIFVRPLILKIARITGKRLIFHA